MTPEQLAEAYRLLTWELIKTQEMLIVMMRAYKELSERKANE